MAKGRKYGGRKAGTPNKTTADVRAALALIAQGNVHAFESWLLAIQNPAQRCDIFLRVMEFSVPKLARTELTAPDGKPLGLPTEERNRIIDSILALIPSKPDSVRVPPNVDEARTRK